MRPSALNARDAQRTGGFGERGSRARRHAGADPRQGERGNGEQHADRQREFGTVQEDQHDENRQQQNGTGQRHQNAQVKAVQCLDVTDQARQHVARLPEPQPTSGAA
jgi:hypothetical protein